MRILHLIDVLVSEESYIKKPIIVGGGSGAYDSTGLVGRNMAGCLME
jgi:hypothetical protein